MAAVIGQQLHVLASFVEIKKTSKIAAIFLGNMFLLPQIGKRKKSDFCSTLLGVFIQTFTVIFGVTYKSGRHLTNILPFSKIIKQLQCSLPWRFSI